MLRVNLIILWFLKPLVKDAYFTGELVKFAVNLIA